MSARRVQFTDSADGYSRDGQVITDERRYAWTPNGWVRVAPAAGMVRVLWDGDREPLWEYKSTLVDL